jgi:hypothetical protein
MAMTRAAVLLLFAVFAVSACGSPSPSLTASAAPTAVASPQVECGDLAAADCAPAAEAALHAVAGLHAIAGTRGVPIRVDLGRGVWCPTLGLLFENTMCPAGGMPPTEGGQWIGNALVTFDGSAAQGYLNIAKDGSTFRAAVIDIATPPPATPAPS